MLTSNITQSVSGVITGDDTVEGGTVYLCSSTPGEYSDSTTIGVGGAYSFTDVPVGTYLVIATDLANDDSGTDVIEVEFGEVVTLNITLDINEGSSGCPVA
jgi:hypothetical protein